MENSILIVDPNTLPIEIEYIKSFIQKFYPDHKPYLLFTHADYDHIIGYGAFPDAEVIAGIDLVELPEKKSALDQIKTFDSSFYISRDYPVLFPKVHHVVSENGSTIVIGNSEMLFYFAKGHVNNSIITVIPSRNLCIAGDYLSNIEIPMVEYSFKEYLNTLQLLGEISEKFNISQVIIGHGDYISSLADFQKRLATDIQYVSLFTSGVIDNSLINKIISEKGYIEENQKIHQKNIDFFSTK
jgi:hydroxyacylglutathione hydrolase